MGSSKNLSMDSSKNYPGISPEIYLHRFLNGLLHHNLHSDFPGIPPKVTSIYFPGIPLEVLLGIPSAMFLGIPSKIPSSINPGNLSLVNSAFYPGNPSIPSRIYPEPLGILSGNPLMLFIQRFIQQFLQEFLGSSKNCSSDFFRNSSVEFLGDSWKIFL